jgi:transposase-like protein
MKPVSYKRHRFPPDVIRHAVWMYFRFALSLRDVEELLAQRELALTKRHRPGGMRANNRAENSHLPIRRRERKQ